MITRGNKIQFYGFSKIILSQAQQLLTDTRKCKK